MKLREIYNTDKTVISFEVFPPKENSEKLLEEIKVLKYHNPAFISLTYGAGGNENKSFELLKQIKDTGINVMPHFTCISTTKKNIERNINKLIDLKIENILALRGDIPENKEFQKHDFNYASDLVEFIKHKTNLSIGVAGYPEGHIESPDLDTDINYLKAKVDKGADAIFTQLFFDNNNFYKFIDKTEKAGINIPIIPGIMPIISKKQVEKMVKLANITVPPNVQENISKLKDKDLIEFGIEYATSQCEELIKNGIKGLHFYTLNKSYSTNEILNNIKGVNIWKI